MNHRHHDGGRENVGEEHEHQGSRDSQEHTGAEEQQKERREATRSRKEEEDVKVSHFK